MTDKSAIFTDLTKRNALRRLAGLPPLDIRAEYAYEIALAAWKAWEKTCDDHVLLYATIHCDVLDDLRKARNDDTFPQTMGGRLMVEALTIDRFERALANRGFHKPLQPSRNAIVYGETVAL